MVTSKVVLMTSYVIIMTTLGSHGDFQSSPDDILCNHYDYLGSPNDYISLTTQVSY